MVLGNKTKKTFKQCKISQIACNEKNFSLQNVKRAKVQSQSSKSQVEPNMTGPYYCMMTSLTDFTITRHALPLFKCTCKVALKHKT